MKTASALKFVELATGIIIVGSNCVTVWFILLTVTKPQRTENRCAFLLAYKKGTFKIYLSWH